MAPEAIMGNVAAASDWWSLGMILLEQFSGGAAVPADINPKAFLLHVMTNGVAIPETIAPRLRLLLRGLLTRDWHRRWQWREVEAWLDGQEIEAPEGRETGDDEGKREGVSLSLDKKSYRSPKLFALAAAEESHWTEARALLLRGDLITWAERAGLQAEALAHLREVARQDDLEDDFRLMLALKCLNADMPLIHQGRIVTPNWLLEYPEDAFRLISGSVPDILRRFDCEGWLSRLKKRAQDIRERARNLDIPLQEAALRIYLLATSRPRLLAEWRERLRLFPDSRHPGLLVLLDRPHPTEEELILLLGASIDQFHSCDAILKEAAREAGDARIVHIAPQIAAFSLDAARRRLHASRQEIFQQVDARLRDFARSGIPNVDVWADQFRLQKRLPLAQALVILSIPEENWRAPPRQQYLVQLMDFFEKKISVSITRGALARMRISKHSTRIDLTELDSERRPSTGLLEHLLRRNTQPIGVDASVLSQVPLLSSRLHRLSTNAFAHRCDTGIDGLYLGFPFLLDAARQGARPRVIPLVLWPVRLEAPPAGLSATLACDPKREACLNPALENLLGAAFSQRLQEATLPLLQSGAALDMQGVLDTFAPLIRLRSATLEPLPAPARLEENELVSAAVLFHLNFSGQAIRQDLLRLRGENADNLQASSLGTLLRLQAPQAADAPSPSAPESETETEREAILTAASDPSQEEAVLQARQPPGLLVEGPPGTGKSQTIVNMVTDAIGNRKSVLVVCQKLAALEVVNKRLLAAGLARRVLMVTDIGERKRVLEHVRAQTENLTPAHDPARLQNARKTLSARIQTLEGELDRLHEATYRLDALSGMSHRQIMGELIQLAAPLRGGDYLRRGNQSAELDGTEKNCRPQDLDVPALRARFADMPRAVFERHQHRCATAARHWRAARFEQSPLHILLPFAADQAVLAALGEAVRALVDAEAAHQKITSEHPQALPISAEDFVRILAWRREHADVLTQTPDALWQKFARWRPLFEAGGGTRIILEFETLTRALDALPWAHHSPRFSLALDLLDDKALARLIRFAQKESSGSWLMRLDPFGFLRRAKLRRFLRENGGEDEPTQFLAEVSELLRAARLERQCRFLRQRFSTLRRTLGELDIVQEGTLALNAHAANDLSSLREVQRRVMALDTAPMPEVARAAVLTTSPAATMRAFLAQLDGGFLRHDAMSKSLAALESLTPWLEAAALEALRQRIRAHDPLAGDLAAMVSALPTLFAFQDFRARIKRGELEADDLELLAPLRALDAQLSGLSDEELEETVRRIFWREACLGWWQRLERADPILCSSRAEIGSKTAALAEADRELLRVNQEWLVRDLEKGALASPKAWEDITRISGARALSLRDFVERGIPLGLLRLVPVWLMNPDVASRILPMQAGLFDMVIYDEASQMPVEYAVPTLYRARAAVVSGDEKQMPPTAFFSARADLDETQSGDAPDAPDSLDALDECAAEAGEAWDHLEIKDCPDLLQLARATLPRTTLRMHYRSAYRELIAFSNAAFYDNALHVPARHPEARIRAHLPVELIRVEGLYQEQTNAEEARRVAEWLADFWRESGEARPSVGIVTFNEKQAELIEEALEARAAADPAFCAVHAVEQARKDKGEDMSLFVKNVENVQGDERDVILFSTTFGRNSLGAFRRNFGVLGQTGGERRLNVAITRARKKVVLMTSMPIRDISDFLDTHRPPAIPRDYLQAYLEYARLLSAGEFPGAKRLLERLDVGRQIRSAAMRAREETDRFRREVGDFLRAQGWQPETPETEDVFGVDFAIEDPKTGLFALGIECDTPRHPLLARARARAREIWRPSVLRQAIPHVHRVSSRAWFLDGRRERELLAEALQKALGMREG
jgi:hypothetical protein